MPHSRHRLFLPALVGSLVLGVAAPAQAGLSGTAAVPTMTVITGTVVAPSSVSTAGTKCVTTYDATTGTYRSTLQAKVSWPGSPSRGVSGYVVVANFTDGARYAVTSVDAATTSVSGTYDVYYASQNIRVPIITRTTYGWAAESALSKAVTC